MLWFRLGAVTALLITFILAISIGCSVFVMCVYPPNPRSMNQDPYYNNTLSYYCVIIVGELEMVSATLFGFIIAFRIWRNNHQMDHKLRHLFTIWLATLGLGLMTIFIVGILGLVRLREPQEDMMSYFEIFSKYNQDIRFVGSFERYQRENSCCGINGPDDWMLAQFKNGGGTSMGGGMGGFGGFGGYDSSYMGSPSTGKCHLTPPTIPMGCGKRLIEEVRFTMVIFATCLILETISGIATACLGWYCFFYWIEKEVIIIPEDEVSNLIVIEPESSASTVNESYIAPNIPSGWSGSVYSANGSVYSSYSKPYNRGSRYMQGSSSRNDRGSRFSYNGYSGSRSFHPNSRRTMDHSRATKFSNFHGSIPTIGGPHSHYFPPHHYESDEEEMANQNYDESLISSNYDRDGRSAYPFHPERGSFYRHPPSNTSRRNRNSITTERSHYRPSQYAHHRGAPGLEAAI
ncbi:Tetraspanin-14 [Orchesella cincta]|uniref:Tetraspanin-14 n=1 Tax=Orchesella cincta TaxID=48709 RepID=A0A1D2NCG0_ORCCI|nr:Tetraspanin-14 [Orchesella cincta]